MMVLSSIISIMWSTWVSEFPKEDVISGEKTWSIPVKYPAPREMVILLDYGGVYVAF